MKLFSFFAQVNNQNLTDLANSFTQFIDRLINAVPNIILGLVIIILGVLIATLFGNFARKRISKRTQDPLMSKFLGRAIKISFILLFVMIGLRAAGLGYIATGILTAAGASALVLGFAFKDIGENFIAGVILAFKRPYNVNDTVEIGSHFGKIKSLEFRYTKLKTFDGKDVYIPNSDVLTKPVINFTEDGYFRWDFVVGIAYENNIDEAKLIINNTLDNIKDVISDEEHQNFVIEKQLATSTVNLQVFFWVDTKDFRKSALITKGHVIKKVKEALEKGGFYMPADIQEIKLYGGEKDFPIRYSK
ncbi:mechanosensitive ion channel protein MscS [Brumimicrobium salinarum]|uniref:Mechanosensitive ion channel protein MscS n=1 Tax=Brumimicrobium salinarum TaxID=2058658 RepID=A0A2I0QZW3_9FLAO|nr:mechanosensitive ion channel domain-containing protein [Brumimicrobium salinarum]PKR79670.1 mechanosensitive ion channel protein MscS [Brumimicrobium salinarum]